MEQCKQASGSEIKIYSFQAMLENLCGDTQRLGCGYICKQKMVIISQGSVCWIVSTKYSSFSLLFANFQSFFLLLTTAFFIL